MARSLSAAPLGDSMESFSGQAALPRQGVRFDRLSTAEGLSFPVVRAILQDERGFMWFATESGLNRYDGYDFTVYGADPGDPGALFSDTLRSLYEDAEGNLWIGTSGGVERLNRDSGTMDHSHPLWGQGQITQIYQDSSGILWVGHWTGLFGYDPVTGDQRYYLAHDPGTPDAPHVLSSNVILALQEDDQGDLWVGTAGGLDQLDRSREVVTHYRHDPTDLTSLSHNVVNALHVDAQDTLWVGTAEGLDRWDAAMGTFSHYGHDPQDPNSLSDAPVSAILEDHAGDLWVGTSNGLHQLDRASGGFVHHLHDPADPHSLSDDVVYALYEDRSGALWIATANGLSRYNRRASGLEYLHGEAAAGEDAGASGLSSSKVLAVYEDRAGILWVGTLRGLNRLDRQQNTHTVYRHDPEDEASLADDAVTAIYEDCSGVLWVGTDNGWLEQFDPQTQTFQHRRLYARVVVIAEDLGGNLWIGTAGEGLYRLDAERNVLQHIPATAPGATLALGRVSHHIVESLRVDRSGALWVGLWNRGVNLLPDPTRSSVLRFQQYEHDPAILGSLGHGRVLSIVEDPGQDGMLWIGTMGGGLNRFDPATQSFAHYREEDGLADDAVACLVFDSAGMLWLSTARGLSRFDPRTETFRSFDERDGVLSGLSAPGVCLRSESGALIFGGADGLYAFHPEQMEENRAVPPVVITALQVSNRTVRQDLAPGAALELSYHENQVGLEYAALDFTAPERNRYAYMLEGVDDDWVDAGTRRYVEYRNLRPGRYIFWVRGSNGDGVWNDTGAWVTITISPPFWGTWWFQAMAAGLLIAALVGGYRLRIRRLAVRSRELAHQVEERTREIERRRQEIEALYQADEELYRYLDLDRVLQALVDTAVETLGADKGALMVWDERRERLVVRVARGFSRGSVERMSFAPGQGVVGTVAVTGERAAVGDTYLDPRVTRSITDAEGIRSFMQVPIQIEGQIFGVFSADYAQPRAFGEEEQRLLLALAHRAAQAIEKAQLYGQAQELAVVQERQRLARELHDAVTQTLFSASMLADALSASWETDPQAGQDLVRKLRQLNRGALAEMRALLLELRPAVLIESDLGDLLRQLAEAVTGREGLPVQVEVEAGARLPPNVHVALYRIAQEALNNVVKHARADRVALRLSCTTCPGEGGGVPRQQVTLTVCDDGRGFDPLCVAPDRLGLGIMRERAEAVGAGLTVDSRPGEGTTITVVWTEGETAVGAAAAAPREMDGGTCP